MSKRLPKSQVAEILAGIQSDAGCGDYHRLRRQFEGETVARLIQRAEAILDNYTAGRPSFCRTDDQANDLMTIVEGF